MGKSKHASFSSIHKPNFLHIKTKFGNNCSKKKLKENEKNGGINSSEEKEKKRFWFRWLGFARKRLSTESCQNAAAGNMVLIAQYEKARYAETPQEKILVSGDVYPEFPQIEDKNEKDIEQLVNVKRLNCNADTNSSAPENTESLLTSELFIRQDLDKLVESAILIEPSLPRDYSEPKNSDDISPKTPKCYKKRAINKISEESIDPIIMTFKTVSEPTCKERTKMIQQQRLKDNINNLIKQFMFLEAEDVSDFFFSQNPTDPKKEFQCSDLNSKSPLLGQLSREVSPEVLVNKKPFKEYVSNDCLNTEKSSAVKMIKNQAYKNEDSIKTRQTIKIEEVADDSQTDSESRACTIPFIKSSATFVKRKDCTMCHEASESISSIPTTEKEIKNVCYEDFTEDTSECGSGTNPGEDESKPSVTIWGVYKSYRPCKVSLGEDDISEILKEIKDEKEDKEEKTFVEKVCKIKIEAPKPTDEKVEESKRKVEEKNLPNEVSSERSLDEIIASLDTENHNFIFQKNISQFKKKINVMPRFGKSTVEPIDSKKLRRENDSVADLRKSAPNAIKFISENAVQKTIKSQSLPVAKPLKKSPATIAKITIGNPSENKIEKFRFECLERTNCQRALRFLENLYLTHSDAKLFSRTLSTRIEAMTVSFLQTFREVYALMENNNSTIMEMVIPRSFEENLIKITLIRTETNKALSWSGRLTPESNSYGAVTSVLPEYDFNRNFYLERVRSESSSSFLDTDECLFLSQDLVSLPGLELIDISNQDIASSRLVRTSTETLIKAEVIGEMEEFEINETEVSSRTENILIFQPCFEAPQNVVEILNNSYRAYPVQIYENVLPFRKLSIKNLSDSDLAKEVANSVAKSYSDSAVGSVENLFSIKAMITFNEKKLVEKKKKDINFGLDGFQILYNNSRENLDDDEEPTKPVFGRRLPGKDPGFIIENIYKEEEEEEEEGEKELKKKNAKSLHDKINENPENISRKILHFKSNSSPKESIVHTDFRVLEHRFRRSFILSKDTDKDIRKRRFQFGRGFEIRRAGSATAGKKSLYTRKSLVGLEDTFKNLILPDELKAVLSSENKGEGNKKIFIVNKSRTNVNKDLVVAAFNSIKDFHSCKGEAKDGGKMSLVIMLPKNKNP